MSSPDSHGPQGPPTSGGAAQASAPTETSVPLRLLGFERRIRQADPKELPFIFVNETIQFLPYRQAVFWDGWKQGRIGAFSGVSVLAQNAPYAIWIREFTEKLIDRATPEPVAFSMAQECGTQLQWQTHVPAYGLWLPLMGPKSLTLGGVLLFRETPFTEAETALGGFLSEGYGQALALAKADIASLRTRLSGLRRKKAIQIALGVLVLICLIPLRQTVLAPAEVVSRRPHVIRAALEGVISKVHVQPNQVVAAGAPLFSTDDSQVLGRLNVARKNLEAIETEYRQIAQSALFDPKAKARAQVLKAQSDSRLAEVAYLETLLSRADVAAPIDGTVVFDDPHDWIGRPVALGQKVMLQVNPDELILDIRIPENEFIDVEPNAKVLFFPLVAPASPVAATVDFVSYQASATPKAGYAFVLRAQFTEKSDAIRLGRRGTAKLYGPRTIVLLEILRKPLHIARQWLGI